LKDEAKCIAGFELSVSPWTGTQDFLKNRNSNIDKGAADHE
jgi:hypothetical protein